MRIAPGMTVAMRVLSGVNILISTFTIFLYLKYPRMQKKSLHTIVCYMSICNIFTAIGICIGLPNNGTVECYIQAFLTNVFPLATIFWTTTIAYMVFCIIYKSRKIDVNSKKILFVTFALPVVLTLLPLSTETYGSPENEDDWCFVRERASSNAPEWTTMFWSVFCFYGWIFLNVLLYIILLCLALQHIFKLKKLLNTDSITLNKMQASIQKLIWYPLITLVVWTPSAIYDFTELHEPTTGKFTNNSTQYVAYLFPALHGILMSIAFFATNSDVHVVLKELWQGRGLPDPMLLENLVCQMTESPSITNRSSGGSSCSGTTITSLDSKGFKAVNPVGYTQTYAAPSTASVLGKKSVVVKKNAKAINNPLGWRGDDDVGNFDDSNDINDYNYV